MNKEINENEIPEWRENELNQTLDNIYALITDNNFTKADIIQAGKVLSGEETLDTISDFEKANVVKHMIKEMEYNYLQGYEIEKMVEIITDEDNLEIYAADSKESQGRAK